MKLVRFESKKQQFVGFLEDDRVIQLCDHGDSRRCIEESGMKDSAQDKLRLPLAEVSLLPPIHNPAKIIGIGLNYLDHCREQNIDPPPRPILFAKFPSAIIGPNEQISWNENVTSRVDYEAELGIVIGKRARAVSAESALRYVYGYTCLNDVSARDLQFGDTQWVRGKSLDTFCPVGPAIVTVDEIPDPNKLRIVCRVNGETLQESSTSEMIFDVSSLIAYISQGITLEPGDLIASGTPHGVGVFREPKRFLRRGDVVEVEIEKIGILVNGVKGGRNR
jgi:acylpyruvate hydrolase